MGRGGTLRIATIGGIDVKLHWSWLLIAVLLTYILAVGRFPALVPGETFFFYLIVAVIGAILFFVSVLLHELSHSFVARARGYKVGEIILFIFGGVANLEEEPRKASDEFLIAVVGPLVSVLLGGLFWGLGLAVGPPVGRAGSGAAAVFEFLAITNILLAIFNMIPGFPLDGGRVLRSIVWGITRNFKTATRFAGVIGQIVAYFFIGLGLYQTFFLSDFGGLWIAFIGWFLLNAAQQSVNAVNMKDAFRGATAGQVMEPPPPAIMAHSTLAHLLSSFILPYNLRAVPVVDQSAQLAGIITLGDIKDVPQEEWGTVTVGQLMTGPEKLRVARVQDGLERVMQLLGEGDYDQLPVIDAQNRLVGIVTRARVLRWLQLREETGLPKQDEGRKTKDEGRP